VRYTLEFLRRGLSHSVADVQKNISRKLKVTFTDGQIKGELPKSEKILCGLFERKKEERKKCTTKTILDEVKRGESGSFV
jgi:hypothetical protein